MGAKAATLACAVDAFLNGESERLRGKAVGARAVGYTAGLFLVPVIWRLLPDRGRYPRGLDLAVTTPLLIDAAGNALGLYEAAHLDDLVHFLNAAIVSGVAGALFAGQVERPWHAAVAGTGAAIAGETAWEIAEYVAMKAGADNMDLGYADTMADLADSAAGAIVGGVITWLRMPREKEERPRTAVVAMLQDRVVPTPRQLKLAHDIPEATLHTVPAGHSGCIAAPERFLVALIDACQSVRARLDPAAALAAA